jgi:hypothetical protein
MADDIYMHPAPVAMVNLDAPPEQMTKELAVSEAYSVLQDVHGNLSPDGWLLNGTIDPGRIETALTQIEDAFPELFTPAEMDDSMDGDHASALAAAGWGTDEDYGGGDGNEHF